MRILVIEDEKKVSQFLKKGFQAESFTVDIANDGDQGIKLAFSENYDAIVLDIMLPKKDGFQVLRELRLAKIKTPILVLSAKSDLENRIEGLNLGADDYLPKPFAFSELIARVRALVRRIGAADTITLLSIDDLTIDIVTRKVTRAKKEIILTKKEYEVLEYLLRNRDRVISRVILTERIWDMNFDSDTNIVDVVINRLRRKIDDEHQVKLIHTVRGVGYVIRSEP